MPETLVKGILLITEYHLLKQINFATKVILKSIVLLCSL
jgi:hypothetical protein